MDNPNPLFHELFAQLGLPCDAVGIAAFVKTHSPLAGDIALHDADFWTPQQAQLLKEWLREDGEEAITVDELNVRLHRGK